MTKTEAIKRIENHTQYYVPVEDLPALEIALDALRDQVEAENLWHNAKTNPPKSPGLYYGKKDDTNSMWLCKYRDGIWTLDSVLPEQRMNIIWWAEYTAFTSVG